MLLGQPFGAKLPTCTPPQILIRSLSPVFHVLILPLTCCQKFLQVTCHDEKCGGSPASVHSVGFTPIITFYKRRTGISGLSEPAVGLIYFILRLTLVRLVLIYFLARAQTASAKIRSSLYVPGYIHLHLLLTTVFTGSKCPKLSFSSPWP